jgi:hypothetical protein
MAEIMWQSSGVQAASDAWELFWYFTRERHAIYQRRVAGVPPPWTEDPVLSSWRFTNAYRAADRVSQYLIRHVIYDGDDSPEEMLFRILLFKWFNRVGTWNLLVRELGTPAFRSFDVASADLVLRDAQARGERVYSAAYIVPPTATQPRPKHAGHLRLTAHLMESGLTQRVRATDSLEDLYRVLLACPGMGPFLAFQFAIDINYSTLTAHDEDEFVVAGPGALDGLSKVWPGSSPKDSSTLIRRTAHEQQTQLSTDGEPFTGLWGRPLKLVDCQNLYCEISKYLRGARPNITGRSGRSRIKQRFTATATREAVPAPFFPPKWGINL